MHGQKISVPLVEDTDGGDAAETVRFGLDGIQYEIGLGSEHAEELRALAAPYVKRARKTASSGRGAARTRNTARNGTDPGKVRDWAKGRGIKVNDRGRVPADAVAQYEAANS